MAKKTVVAIQSAGVRLGGRAFGLQIGKQYELDKEHVDALVEDGLVRELTQQEVAAFKAGKAAEEKALKLAAKAREARQKAYEKSIADKVKAKAEAKASKEEE